MEGMVKNLKMMPETLIMVFIQHINPGMSANTSPVGALKESFQGTEVRKADIGSYCKP